MLDDNHVEYERKLTAALATLRNLGYTWNGGELWRPPLGKAPNFDDEAQNKPEELVELECLFQGFVRYTGAPDKRIFPMMYSLLDLNEAYKNDLDLAGSLNSIFDSASQLGAAPYAKGGTIPAPEKKDPAVERVEELAIHFAKTAARVLQDAVTPVYKVDIVDHGDARTLADHLTQAPSYVPGGVVGEAPRTQSFTDMFYGVCEALGITGAQPISPREVYETQVLPKLKELTTSVRDTELLNGLVDLMGYIQNGSDTIVKVFQDDATRTYHVRIGNTSLASTYWGNTFREALEKAIKGEVKNEQE